MPAMTTTFLLVTQIVSAAVTTISVWILRRTSVTNAPDWTPNLHSGSSMETTFPYAESTLSYEYRPSCFFQWYNRLGLEQSDFAVGQYKEVYRTGIRVDHTFGQKMKAGGSVYYSYNQYKQPFSFAENDLDANATLSYAIDRSLSVQAGYTFTRASSEIVFRDYYRNKIFLGASFAF